MLAVKPCVRICVARTRIFQLAESLETSEIHLDVLTNLKRISSHISQLVFPILDEEA